MRARIEKAKLLCSIRPSEPQRPRGPRLGDPPNFTLIPYSTLKFLLVLLLLRLLSGNLGTELFSYIDDILTMIAGIVNLSNPICSAENILFQGNRLAA